MDRKHQSLIILYWASLLLIAGVIAMTFNSFIYIAFLVFVMPFYAIADIQLKQQPLVGITSKVQPIIRFTLLGLAGLLGLAYLAFIILWFS